MKFPKIKTVKIMFCTYSLIMLWLLLGQRLNTLVIYDYSEQIKQNTNLIPFITIKRYITLIQYTSNILLVKHAIVNLLGNIIMFVPLGVFLPIIYKKARNYLIFLFFIIVSISFIEVVQLFTLLGSCDIDDLIFNTFGATVGYIFYLIFNKIIKTRK